MTPISKRHCARYYIYKKKQNDKMFKYIYKRQDTLQKSTKFALYFTHKQPDTLRYAIFDDLFGKRHLYILKKYEILRHVMFLYTKILTLRNSTKILTLCIMSFFMGFKIDGGGEALL